MIPRSSSFSSIIQKVESQIMSGTSSDKNLILPLFLSDLSSQVASSRQLFSTASFFIYFRSFQTPEQFQLQQINVKNDPSAYRDSNSQPLDISLLLQPLHQGSRLTLIFRQVQIGSIQTRNLNQNYIQSSVTTPL